MNFQDINKNKILLISIALTIIFTSGISDSLAQLPSGPIEITIENVTINTPTEESEGNPLTSEITAQIILLLVGFVGGGGTVIWKIIETRASKNVEIEKAKAAATVDVEKAKALAKVDI